MWALKNRRARLLRAQQVADQILSVGPDGIQLETNDNHVGYAINSKDADLDLEEDEDNIGEADTLGENQQ